MKYFRKIVISLFFTLCLLHIPTGTSMHDIDKSLLQHSNVISPYSDVFIDDKV